MMQSNIKSGLSGLFQYRGLLVTLILRDLRAKYRDTSLGIWWLVLHPLLMLSTYAFVFGGIFGSRWQNEGGAGHFVLMLFCGLIFYALLSDTINRATTLVRSQPNFVKKVVFPLEIMPMVIVGSSVFSGLVNILILLVLSIIVNQAIEPTAILLPVVLLPMVIMVAGFAWGLSALGVFFTDLAQIVTFLTSLLLFLSPVFFPVSAAPKIVQPFLMLNPLTFPIEEARKIALLGQYPNWAGLVIYAIIACGVAIGGLWLFQRSRSAFADVV